MNGNGAGGRDENKTRAQQIFDAFVKFHKEHPEVWTLFQRFTQDIINRGLTRYSADAVCHRIRWHTSVELSGELKINDHFTCYYARMFAARYPQHEGLFRNRKRPSESQLGYLEDMQEFVGRKPENEERLYEALRELAEIQQ